MSMTPKLFKAAEVCDMAQLQPYVLRSWEKEFPGIGVQKSPDSPRLYRQADVEHVLKIKQLVFAEGLTLAGARRRLEVQMPAASNGDEADVAEVLDALASDTRTRIAHVRDGLRSILKLLSTAPGTLVVVDDYQLQPPPRAAKNNNGGARAVKKPVVKKVARSAASRTKARVAAKPSRTAKPARKARRASA